MININNHTMEKAPAIEESDSELTYEPASWLPGEMWLEVLKHLGAVDIIALSRVCRRMLRMSRDKSVWERVMKKYGRNTQTLPLTSRGNE